MDSEPVASSGWDVGAYPGLAELIASAPLPSPETCELLRAYLPPGGG
jgi:hypothetical protein